MGDDSRNRVRLAGCEVNLSTGELRNGYGSTVLQDQPLQLLRLLIEREGRLVSREEIKGKLWPNDTIVEFDASINAAIRNLRRALGDSADEPKYIETFPRRGYRLMVAIQRLGADDASHSTVRAGTQAEDSSPSDRAVKSNRVRGWDSGLVGKKVSHYRVLEVIGGGGGGMVYKAEDLNLGRQVALKFLPPELAGDPGALQRFQREACAASSLNHPNICTIYEGDEYEGQPFIAMELLDGQSLRACLISGEVRSAGSASRLDTSRVVDIALQIADGLQAAHEKGVIHRDIKPANLFLTARNVVKILDFGIAKVLAEKPQRAEEVRAAAALPSSGWAALSDGIRTQPGGPPHGNEDAEAEAPSLQANNLPETTLTRFGIALGTAGYMSPEQIRGEKLDARSDIFSFGLVLYEMATGQRAFTGETAIVVQDAILQNMPVPAHGLNPGLPRQLEAVIDKALEKDRDKRYQSVAELRSALQTASQNLPQPGVSSHRYRWALPVAVVLAVAFVLCLGPVAAWYVRHMPERVPHPSQRRITANPVGMPVQGAVISPDGKYLGYNDPAGVHIRIIETQDTQSVSLPQGASPDGSWWFGGWYPDSTRFFVILSVPGRPDSIWTMSILGGAPSLIVEDASDASLSSDGTFVFTRRHSGWGAKEIWCTGPQGESPQLVLTAVKDEFFRSPGWWPTGRRIAFETVIWTSRGSLTRIEYYDIDQGKRTTLVSDAGELLVLPSGRLVYSLNNGSLWTTQVDSHNGTISGKPRELLNLPGVDVLSPSATVDEKKLAFIRRTDNLSVVTVELANGGVRELTRDQYDNEPIGWTADSQGVFIFSDRDGSLAISRQMLDGSSAKSVFVSSNLHMRPGRTSPDGQWIVFYGGPNATPEKRAIYRVSVNGGVPEPMFDAPVPQNWGWGMSCANRAANFCAYGEYVNDHHKLIITEFELLQGKGKQLAQMATQPQDIYYWDLAPDGSEIAVANSSENSNEITFIRIPTNETRKITVKGYDNIHSLRYSSDSQSIFCGVLKGNDTWIVRVGRDGTTLPIARVSPSPMTSWALISPDGRHLAVRGENVDANAWMLEDF